MDVVGRIMIIFSLSTARGILKIQMLWGGGSNLNIMRVYGNQNGQNQELMNRSMQLHYNPVTAFSKTGLFLDRIFPVSIPITRNLLTSLRHWTGTAFLSQKKRYTKNRPVGLNMLWHGLVWELHTRTHRLLTK